MLSEATANFRLDVNVDQMPQGDLTYYVLRGLAAVGIVWDLREPPARVREPNAESQPVSRAAA